MGKGFIMLAAGGTGGHLFPAEALAHELKARGYQILLATDERADKYAANFPANHKEIIVSATMGSKNPVALAKMFWKLLKGYRQSRQVIERFKPMAAVGFGGYPTLPPLLAAIVPGIPRLVHEQNAILGRANRMLAKRVKAVAVGFPQIGPQIPVPVIETGNPVRPIVSAVIGAPYSKRAIADSFRLVVFGGSQGARFLSEILPKGLALLEPELRGRLSILQQAREEDAPVLYSAYSSMGITAEISPFFANMPEEISKADFVIARAGASSVTELAVIGRPSLLVPLPGSLDGDQAANAAGMSQAGGAFVVAQSSLTGEKLAEILKDAMEHPANLAKMASAASSTGIPDAAKRLADCVECVISGGDITALNF